MLLRSGSKGFHFLETVSRLLDYMRNCDFRDTRKVVKIGNNLRSGVLFSDPPTLALLYFHVPPKKERLIAG